MRIKSINMQGFGPFRDSVELDFTPVRYAEGPEIHLFTGINGCGKSTLLYAMVQALIPEDYSNLDNSGIMDYLLSCRKNCHLVSGTAYTLTLESESGNAESIAMICTESGLKHQDRLPESLFRYHQEAEYYQERKDQNPAFDFVFLAYAGYASFGYCSPSPDPDPETSNPLELALNFIHSKDCYRYLTWLYGLSRDSGEHEETVSFIPDIEQAISKVAGHNIRFEFENSDSEDTEIYVTWDGTGPIHFDALAEGLRSLIGWLGDLITRLQKIPWQNSGISYLEQRIILFLDEIETHLHPAWQRRLLPALQELLPNAQMFVATHSPFVAGSVDGANVYVFEFDPVKGSRLKAGSPFRSNDGDTYEIVTREVFGIEEKFGYQVEKDFQKFYRLLRDELYLENRAHIEEFSEIARKLHNKSRRTRSIVDLELMQLEQQTGLSISLNGKN